MGHPGTRVRVLGFAAVLAAGLVVGQADASPQAMGRVTATAGILIDRTTGEVVWERNADLQLPPASTTKVLTTLVALRSARINDTVTVSHDAAQAPPSKIGLRPGWRLQMDDLLYAVMLNSANDAAEVVAEGVAGSVPAFAERMTREAHRLGATNSYFANPHGLPAEGHVSTARDLTRIFDAALRDPRFLDIASTQQTYIFPVQGARRRISLRSHNRFLEGYKVRVLGKTGYTRAAKKCFVGAVMDENGHELLVSILGSRDLWGDLGKVLEYGLADERSPEPPLLMAQNEAPLPPDTMVSAAGDSDDDDRRPARVRSQRKSVALNAKAKAAASAALARSTKKAASSAALEKRGEPRTRTLTQIASAPKAKSTNEVTGIFIVQLGSFTSADRAEQLRAAVGRSGFNATVRRVLRDQGTMYRVTVGEFRTDSEARIAATKLRKAHTDLRPMVVALN